MAIKKNSTTNIHRDVYPLSSRYLAVSSSERSGMHPAAEVDMDKGYYEYNSDHYDVNDRMSGDYYDEGTDQMRLFNMRPAKISYAFSDHSLRSRVPTLLGMAINDAKDAGFGLTYDDSLTAHSSRLAKRGMAKGILTRNPNNPLAYGDEWDAEDLDTHEYLIDKRTLRSANPADPNTISRSKETIRDLVRSGRPAKHMGPQFKHPDLDIEWHQPELGK